MRSEQYGQEVADIIVSENGTLVAEDIWHGFDEGVREAISEYLEENGATVYDLTENSTTGELIILTRWNSIEKRKDKQGDQYRKLGTNIWTGKNLKDEEQKFSFLRYIRLGKIMGLI